MTGCALLAGQPQYPSMLNIWIWTAIPGVLEDTVTVAQYTFVNNAPENE